MIEVHTHTFVGGHYDGRREVLEGADAERGAVSIMTPPPLLPTPPDSDDHPSAVVAARAIIYERAAYEGEKVRFIFWKARDLTIDEALTKLFAHYIDR